MGFFKDLKEDISQAMNELMPDNDLLSEENLSNKENLPAESMEKESSESKKADQEQKGSTGKDTQKKKRKSKSGKKELQDILEEEVLSAINALKVDESSEQELSEEESMTVDAFKEEYMQASLFDDEDMNYEQVSLMDDTVIEELNEDNFDTELAEDFHADIAEMAATDTVETESVEETATTVETESVEETATTVETESVEEAATTEDSATENHEELQTQIEPSSDDLFDGFSEEELLLMGLTEEEVIQRMLDADERKAQEEKKEIIPESVQEEEVTENEVTEDLSVASESEITEEEASTLEQEVIQDEIESTTSDMEDTKEMGFEKINEINENEENKTEEKDMSQMDEELMNGMEEDATDMDLIAQLLGDDAGDEAPIDEALIAETEEVELPEETVQVDAPVREPGDDVTIITKGTRINGSITSDGSLEVMGTVVGDIDCLGTLSITGSVNGNSKAAEISVNTARLEGGLDSTGCVKIGVGTIVVGNVKASSAVIAGAIKGEVDVNGPVEIDSTAIVKGNINAKSVQINNGAVVDGYCSLSYAAVDIDNFFDSDKNE